MSIAMKVCKEGFRAIRVEIHDGWFEYDLATEGSNQDSTLQESVELEEKIAVWVEDCLKVCLSMRSKTSNIPPTHMPAPIDAGRHMQL